MKVPIYKDGLPAGAKEVPDDIVQMAVTLDRWMEMNDCTQVAGVGPVRELQRLLDGVTAVGERVLDASEEMKRQLDQVTRERDHFKTACELADALRNHERGMVPK